MAGRGKDSKGSILWRIAPPRFLLFLVLYVVGVPVGVALIGWREGTMIAFDIAVIAFILSCLPLFDDEAAEMRHDAERNDANRPMLLGITALVGFVVMAAVAAELSQQGSPSPAIIVLVVGTLLLSWSFSTLVYALHYAHCFYTRERGGKDSGGIAFPGTEEPDYWDFLYFSATIGMTFQTSDTDIESRRIRKIATFHSFVAFAFNLGVVAFTINVLGGG